MPFPRIWDAWGREGFAPPRNLPSSQNAAEHAPGPSCGVAHKRPPCASNDVVDVQPGGLRIGLLRERANPLDHRARPVAIPDDELHSGPCLRQVRHRAGEPPQTGIAVVDDGGEWLRHGQVPPNQTAVFSVVALFNVIVLSFATDHFGKHVSIPLHIIRVRELRKWHVAELLRTVGR